MASIAARSATGDQRIARTQIRHDIGEMKHPIQRKSRRQGTKRSRNAPSAEAFTPESAKDYVLDLVVRGELRIADKQESKVSTSQTDIRPC
jgi:hypothetical protein